jgi:hypothetical protein
MRRYTLSFAAGIGYAHPHPERTAKRAGRSLGAYDMYQVWSNREAMARSIRMQQRRATRIDDWRPLVPLSDGEGY